MLANNKSDRPSSKLSRVEPNSTCKTVTSAVDILVTNTFGTSVNSTVGNLIHSAVNHSNSVSSTVNNIVDDCVKSGISPVCKKNVNRAVNVDASSTVIDLVDLDDIVCNNKANHAVGKKNVMSAVNNNTISAVIINFIDGSAGNKKDNNSVGTHNTTSTVGNRSVNSAVANSATSTIVNSIDDAIGNKTAVSTVGTKNVVSDVRNKPTSAIVNLKDHSAGNNNVSGVVGNKKVNSAVDSNAVVSVTNRVHRNAGTTGTRNTNSSADDNASKSTSDELQSNYHALQKRINEKLVSVLSKKVKINEPTVINNAEENIVPAQSKIGKVRVVQPSTLYYPNQVGVDFVSVDETDDVICVTDAKTKGNRQTAPNGNSPIILNTKQNAPDVRTESVISTNVTLSKPSKSGRLKNIISSKNGVFTCNICYDAFSSEADCVKHASFHVEISKTLPFVSECNLWCSKCSKLYNHKVEFQQHLPCNGDGAKTRKTSSPILNDVDVDRAPSALDVQIMDVSASPATDVSDEVINLCEDEKAKTPTRSSPAMKNFTDETAKYQCWYCSLIYTQAITIENHMKSSHVKKPAMYRCLSCNVITSSLRTHGHQQACKCLICNKYFNDGIALSNHEKFYHYQLEPRAAGAVMNQKELDYICEYCGNKFEFFAHIQYHMQTSHPNMVPKYFCSTFSKSFVTPDNHIRYRVECEGCSRVFTDEFEYITHLSTCKENLQAKANVQLNDAIWDYVCVYCSMKLSTVENMKLHLSKAHSKYKFKYHCSKCDKLLTNVYDTHAQHGFNATCRRCEHNFTDEIAWNQHTESCFKISKRPVGTPCKKCDTVTYDPDQCINHENQHYAKKTYVKKPKASTEVRPSVIKAAEKENQEVVEFTYGCSYCQKKFLIADEVVRHVRHIHPIIAEPVYTCLKCSKSFVSLEKHSHRLNTTCRLCEREFPTRLKRDEHESERHKEVQVITKPANYAYSCVYCPERFTVYSDIVVHVLNLHKIEDVVSYFRCLKCADNFPCGKKHVHKLKAAPPVETIVQPPPKSDQEPQHRPAQKKKKFVAKPNYFVCVLCSRSFDSCTTVRYHIRNAHKDSTELKTYRCRKCVMLYPVEQDHVHEIVDETTSEQYQYVCVFCSDNFNSYKSLVNHVSTIHKNIDDPECTENYLIVEQRENSETTVEEPNRLSDSVEDIKLIECKSCDKMIRRTHYFSHVKLKHPQNVCVVCNKTFESSQETQIHQYKMHAQKLIREKVGNAVTCDQCIQIFGCREELLEHKKCHKRTESVCNICKETLPTASALEEHQKMVHGKNYSCETCKQTFSSMDKCRRHENKHKQANFECDVCKKKYKDERLRDLCKRQHSNCKNFKCTVCSKQFVYFSTLREHLHRHRTEKKYRCITCRKVFSTEENLNAHIVTHAVESNPQ